MNNTAEEDATAMLKAEERRRRVISMLEDSTAGTATAVRTVVPRRTGKEVRTAVASPPNTMDLQVKAAARQGHMSRMLTTTDTEDEPVQAVAAFTTNTTLDATESKVIRKAPVAHGALRALEEKAATRQGHMTRLLHENGSLQAAEDRIRQKKTTAEPVIWEPTTTQDSTTTTTTTTAQRPAATTSRTTTTTTASTDANKVIHAKIVNDHEERELIVQQAQADLIAKAVVASSVEEGKGRDNRCCRMGVGVMVLILVLLGSLVGGLCGSGLCRSAGPQVDPVQRAADMTALLNTVKRSETPLVWDDGADSSTPEQEALTFLVAHDALQLDPTRDDDKRIIQRFALAVLWFTNGPWDDTFDLNGAEIVDGDPTRNWFVHTDECRWTGVTCTDGVVTELSLPAKDMVGTLPHDLTLLTALTALLLQDNDLTGTIPSFLTEFTALERLDLQESEWTGPAFPSFLSQLTALKEFVVNDNDLTGSFPASFASMTQLEVIALAYNDIVGTLPDFLTEFSSLRKISLSYNDLTGTIPTSLWQLTNMESLKINMDTIDGTYNLADFQNLSKLTELSVSQMSFDGQSFQDEMANWWPNMESLYMIRCGLVGSIPESFAAWTNFRDLDLSNNGLTGTLPAAVVAAWTDLTHLAIGFNDFEGTLPTEIGAWSNVYSFDIRNNMFTGTLPTEVGVMTELEQFLVTSNQFSGEIPAEVLNFSDAYTWLDLNAFSGVAPYCVDSSRVVEHRVDCALVECECCSEC